METPRIHKLGFFAANKVKWRCQTGKNKSINCQTK